MPSPYHAGFSPAETPSPSAPSVTAISSATLTSTRDRDLISSDELLTDDALDELWAWFCGAAKGGTDLQLVFVKLINFARKPYMKHSDVTSTRSRSMIPATPRSGASDIDISRLWRHGSNTSTACDTPSERTVVDHDPANYGHHSNAPTDTQLQAPTDTQLQVHQALQTTVTQLRQESAHLQTTVTQLREESAHLQTTVTQLRQEGAQLQTTITQLRQENAQLQSKAQALETTVTQLRHENAQLRLQSKAQALTRTMPAPVRVAIKSVHFSERYVQLGGSDFQSHHPTGGGRAGVHTFIGDWEALELVHHPGGLVSFKSTCFENIFLRAEAKGLHPGQTPDGGGGVVNCQYGCGKLEKFRILKVGYHGEVVIEPAEFPGRYLRVDGNCLDSMKLQGAVRTWEKFYLVIVP